MKDIKLYYEFTGPFKDYIEEFIKNKQYEGNQFGKSIQCRWHTFCNELNILTDKPTITEEIAWEINTLKDNETPGTRYRIALCCRELATFINNLGKESYILPIVSINRPAYHFVPYVLSHSQMKLIFENLDNQSNTNRFDIAFPIFIRLLYSTGIRLGEATNLKNQDINFDDLTITIRESKNNKTRVIPLSISMFECLQRYLDKFPNNKLDDYIFSADENSKYSHSYLLRKIKYIYIEIGIRKTQYGKIPNLHSLRHTFAIHTLEKMNANGKNSYNSIALLCQYLGHKSINETEKYLRIPQYKYDGIEQDKLFSNKIPEVLYEE